MSRHAGLLLTFAIAFAVLLMLPPFLSGPFGPFPLMRMGGVTDVLTPLILIPLYWLLFEAADTRPAKRREVLMFLMLAALWSEGHGMHLAANSVNYLFHGERTSALSQLVYFYDEALSHYLWHIGVAGFVVLLLWRSSRPQPAEGPVPLWPGLAGGMIYGFTFFAITVEAQTALLGVPFAALVTTAGATGRLKWIRREPLPHFFFVAHVVAVGLFVLWAVWWSGFPEFSDPRVRLFD